jgi:hypothetical protein
MNSQNNTYYPFATCEDYTFIQCMFKKKGRKEYYDDMGKDENTVLRF